MNFSKSPIILVSFIEVLLFPALDIADRQTDRQTDSQTAPFIYTSMQLWPLATLLAKPNFSGLWSQNCLKDGHVLWKYMSFRMTCPMSAYVLVECMSSGWHILLYVLFYGMAFLTG